MSTRIRVIAVGIVASIMVSVAIPFLLTDYYLSLISLAFISSVIAIGTNVLTGRAGLFSIGNAAFMAIAAWIAALAASSLGFVATVVVASFVCAAVGVLIGIPSLRLRNFYMVITTLALQVIVVTAFFQFEIATDQPTGFFLPAASIGPLEISDMRTWYAVLAVILLVVLAAAGALFSSRVGRAWYAIREHDIAAGVLGVNVRYYKLLAFAVSSFIIGLGGGLYAYFTRFVSADAYTLTLAISYVAMIIIGGLGSLPGSVVGAFIVTLLPVGVQGIGDALSESTGASGFVTQNQYYIQAAIYGAVVLLFLYRQPDGIAGIVKHLTARRSAGRAGMADFDVTVPVE